MAKTSPMIKKPAAKGAKNVAVVKEKSSAKAKSNVPKGKK